LLIARSLSLSLSWARALLRRAFVASFACRTLARGHPPPHDRWHGRPG